MAEQNETRQSLFEALEPKYQKAIELRYKGFTYEQIAKHDEIKVVRSTVNMWFVEPSPEKPSPAGLLYTAYQEYKVMMRSERDHQYESAINQLYEMALEAMVVVRILMNKNSDGKKRTKAEVDADRNRLLAAQDVLDRTIGKMQNIDLTSKGRAISLGSMDYEDLIKEAQNHGINTQQLIDEIKPNTGGT